MDTRHSAKAVPAKDGQEQDELEGVPGGEIGRVLMSYTNRIGGLRTAVWLSTKTLSEYKKARLTDFQEYAKKYNLNPSDGEQRVALPHLEDHLKTLGELEREYKRTLEAQKLVPRSLFVCMVSEYESLLARLLTTVFNLKPEMCIQFKEPIKVKQALEFESIDALHAYIVAAEVDGVMRKNTAEQLEYFAQTMHAIDVGECDGVTDVYEVSLRRNLYVHCDGIAGQQYVNECTRLHAKMPEDHCGGKVLEMTPDYFFSAGELLLTLGLELGASLWWNDFRKGRNKIADFLNRRVMIGLLVEKHYAVAAHLGEYALRRFGKDLRDVDRRVFVINTAQAYKWNEDEANCKRILETEDWGATADYLKFGVAVLQDKSTEAAGYMVKIGPHGDIDEVEYHEWPLLHEFRKTKEFASAYKRVFRRLYNDFPREARPVVLLNTDKS